MTGAKPERGEGRKKSGGRKGRVADLAATNVPAPPPNEQWHPDAARMRARRMIRDAIPNEENSRAKSLLQRVAAGECDTLEGFRAELGEVISPIELEEAVAYIELQARRAASERPPLVIPAPPSPTPETEPADVTAAGSAEHMEPVEAPRDERGEVATDTHEERGGCSCEVPEGTGETPSGNGGVAGSDGSAQPSHDSPTPPSEVVERAPKRKPRPRKTSIPTGSSLPVPQAYYAVVELPPETAPSPEPAIVNKQGVSRGFWAVWWTVIPQLDALEPPDALGVYEGANCAIEAMTEADRVARREKGPRAYVRPLHPSFAHKVYRDGIQKRQTSMTHDGPTALAAFGFKPPHDFTVITEKLVTITYRRMLVAQQVHPDHGGTEENFIRMTKQHGVAILFVRAMREQLGLHHVPDVASRRPNMTARIREYLTQIAVAGADAVFPGHTDTLRTYHDALERKGFVEYVEGAKDKTVRVTRLGREMAKKFAEDIEKSALSVDS